MTFLEKLDCLLKEKKMNKHKFSELSNIPYTTIMGWYQRGYAGMTLSAFKKICDYFGVTLDSMARDELGIEYYNPNKKDLHLTKDEELFLQCYRSADDMHRGLAECAIGADKTQDTAVTEFNAG